jgi:hypothetical protein
MQHSSNSTGLRGQGAVHRTMQSALVLISVLLISGTVAAAENTAPSIGNGSPSVLSPLSASTISDVEAMLACPYGEDLDARACLEAFQVAAQDDPRLLGAAAVVALAALLTVRWIVRRLLGRSAGPRTFSYNLVKTVVYIGEPMLSKEAMMEQFDEVPTDLEPYKLGLFPVTQHPLRGFTVEPPLPYGVDLDELTGGMSGIPSERKDPETYTITGRIKKKTYTAKVLIEVRPHQDLPESHRIPAADYTVGPESAYIEAGINRRGLPSSEAPYDAEAPALPTRRKRKKAMKAANQARKREANQRKREQKAEKKARNQAKRSGKNGTEVPDVPHAESNAEDDSGNDDRQLANAVGAAAERAQAEVVGHSDEAMNASMPNEDQPASSPSAEAGETPVDAPTEATDEPVAPLVPEPEAPKVVGTQHVLTAGATEIEFDDASEFPGAGNAWLGHYERGVRVHWTGKEGDTLTGVTGVKRKVPAGSVFQPDSVIDTAAPDATGDQGPSPSPSPASKRPSQPDESTQTAAAPLDTVASQPVVSGVSSDDDGSEPKLSWRERKRQRRAQRAQDLATQAEEAAEEPSNVPSAQPTSTPSSEPATPNEVDGSTPGQFQKGATTLTLADASSLPEEGAAWVGGAERGVRITWTGKSGNTLTGVEGLRRNMPATSTVVLDDRVEEVEEEVKERISRPKF